VGQELNNRREISQIQRLDVCNMNAVPARIPRTIFTKFSGLRRATFVMGRVLKCGKIRSGDF